MNRTCLTTVFSFVFSMAFAPIPMGCVSASAESKGSLAVVSKKTRGKPATKSSALAYDHYLKARLFMTQGRLRQTMDEMRRALLYDHTSPYLHVVLGDLYASQGLWKKADEEATKAMNIDKDDADAVFLKGQAAIHMGRIEKAIGFFERVIALAPKKIAAYATLASIFLSRKDKNKAVELLKKMVSANPESAEGFKKLGDLFFEQGDEKSAEQYYRRVLELSPSDIQTTQTLAGILEQQGRYTEAIKVLGEAMASSPEDPYIMAFMARLYLKDGDNKAASAYIEQLRLAGPSNASLIARTYAEINHQKEAIAELRKVLKEYPNSNRERLLLAILFEEIKQWDQAIANLEMIPVSSPLYPVAQNSIGYCLIQKGEPAKAMPVLENALKLSDNLDTIGRIYINISQAMSKQRKFAEGIKRLDQAIVRYPDLPDLYSAKANLLFEAGKGPEGVRALKSLLMRFPTNINILYALGALYERMGKTEKSIEVMRRLLTVEPNNSAALNFVGYTMADQGKNLDEAERLIRRALRLDPGSGAITDSLGWLLFKRKKYTQALEYLLRADRTSPGEPVILMHVGDVYEKLGDSPKALEYYHRALKANPPKKDKEEILDKLKRLEKSPAR